MRLVFVFVFVHAYGPRPAQSVATAPDASTLSKMSRTASCVLIVFQEFVVWPIQISTSSPSRPRKYFSSVASAGTMYEPAHTMTPSRKVYLKLRVSFTGLLHPRRVVRTLSGQLHASANAGCIVKPECTQTRRTCRRNLSRFLRDWCQRCEIRKHPQQTRKQNQDDHLADGMKD